VRRLPHLLGALLLALLALAPFAAAHATIELKGEHPIAGKRGNTERLGTHRARSLGVGRPGEREIFLGKARVKPPHVVSYPCSSGRQDAGSRAD
jgi:hypothetical protein